MPNFQKNLMHLLFIMYRGDENTTREIGYFAVTFTEKCLTKEIMDKCYVSMLGIGGGMRKGESGGGGAGNIHNIFVHIFQLLLSLLIIFFISAIFAYVQDYYIAFSKGLNDLKLGDILDMCKLMQMQNLYIK